MNARERNRWAAVGMAWVLVTALAGTPREVHGQCAELPADTPAQVLDALRRSSSIRLGAMGALGAGAAVPVAEAGGLRAAREFGAREAHEATATGRHEPRVITFTTDQRTPVGSGPYSVAAGQFDRDGRIDLATANYTVDSISVLLQAPDGGFSRFDLGIAGGPLYVAAGDATGDGLDDLAVVLYAENAVALLVADGAGSFALEGRYAVGPSPTAVCFADLDRDGDLDLACTNAGDNTVSVLRNSRLEGNSAAPLLDSWSTHVVGIGPQHLVAGDFTGDGITDLATADGGCLTVSVLPGTGGGSFAPRLQSHTPVPFALAASDFDGDGDLDLAMATYEGFCILRNDGRGHFAPGPVVDLPEFNSYGLAAADLDGDGDDDLLATSFRSSSYPKHCSVTVLMNTGGTFVARTDVQVGMGPNQLIACDVNRDGRPDAVTANYGSPRNPGYESSVSVLENRGDGRLAGVESRELVELEQEERWTAGISAFERPGHSPRHPTDLLLGTRKDVRLMRNRGDGTFASPVAVIPHPAAAVLDLTGDGVTDAVARLEVGVDRVFVGRHDGSFEPGDDIGYAGSYRFLNLDSDGLPDVLLLDPPGGAYVNLGRGRFSPLRSVPGAELLAGAWRTGAVDLDGDGRDEVLTVRKRYMGGDTLVVLERTADGGFRPGYELVLPEDWQYLYPALITGYPNAPDGGVDIALLYECSGCGHTELMMLRRLPDGSYEQGDILPGVGLEYTQVRMRDLDGDGRGDFVISAGNGDDLDDGGVQVIRNAGHGKLVREQDVTVDYRISASVLIDLDSDHRLDLVAYSVRNGTLIVMTNAGETRANHQGPPGRRPTRAPAGAPRPASPRAELTAEHIEHGGLVLSLPTSGPASLALYDISGRRVLARDLGWLAAGEHAIELPELGRLRAGIYWARVGAKGAGEVRKVVVMGTGRGR